MICAWRNNVTEDEYLRALLTREAVDTGPFSPVRHVQAVIYPTISEWAGRYLLDVMPSGSFAKGTANRSGTDIDLFISLSEQAEESLKTIYDKLFARMRDVGLTPKRQNVSINVKINGYDVDLVPGRRQNAFFADHSLYRKKADTWTKTNVSVHINKVLLSRRQDEIRIIKLWRNQKGLEFPSFYLELAVIEALANSYTTILFSSLAENVRQVFTYLRDKFEGARFVDPANSNNVISDDLTIAERRLIKAAAATALNAPYWEHIVK
jgi:hypothetical protein